METSRDTALREIAELLLLRYGERAATYARLKAFLARLHGERRHVEAWGRITDAVIQAGTSNGDGSQKLSAGST